ncbi:MAG: molecular chaperone DnaJ [Chloroflexota bacterium]
MATTKRDYYEVLGIVKTSTSEEIKKAFRAKARQYHPDVNKEPEAEGQFKEISEAYEVLIDDDKRAAYDRFGHAAVSGNGAGGAGFDPFQNFGSFSDIFETFFTAAASGGGAGTGTRPRRPQRGAHLAYRLTVEFEEAVFGSEKEIEIPRLATCPKCEGSGAEPGTEPQVCPTCNGRGEVRRTQQSIFGQFVSVVPCDRCHGEGKIVTTPCTECKGDGRIRETRKLAVKIPAGIEDGAQIRLASEGEAGPRGAPPGDLYIEVNVKPHKLFKRDGNDLLLDLNINMSQAALGADIQVPTVDGATAPVKIAPGTQNDKVVRVKGMGVPYLRGTGRGDLLVKVNIQIPTSLSEEQKRLLRELGKTFGEATTEPQEKGLFGKLKDALGG